MKDSSKKLSTKHGFTMSVPRDQVPIRVFEQCLQIRALLATLLSIQVDLHAHLTNSDPDVIHRTMKKVHDDLVLDYRDELTVALGHPRPSRKKTSATKRS